MVETVEIKPTLRRRIIEAADTLIREQGIAGATTREIARAAGCAEGSIYVHFEDKIDLVIAVIVEREPYFADLLELPSRAGEETVEANLVPWVEELLKLLLDNQPIFYALMGDRSVFARFKERLRERETGPVAIFRTAASLHRRRARARAHRRVRAARRRRVDPHRRLPRPGAHARAGRQGARRPRDVRARARPHHRLRPRARSGARPVDPERRGGTVVKARIFAEESRKWWTLGAVAFALFMIMLDNTVVNVALPSIQSDLGIGLSELEWTVNAYALTFAVLMLSGGKLADFFGRRRVFLIGLAIFTLSSLACGLATSGETLIGARTVQGVGAALMMPATLSIISATFPPHQRGMAIGIWAGVSAMALAIGPLIGGLVTEHIDWSWIFFLNVPIGIARPDRRPARDPRVARHLARATTRHPGLDRLGRRALRADVRADRGERLRLDRPGHHRPLRALRRLARSASCCSSGTSARRCSTSRSSVAPRSPGRTSSRCS